VGLPWRWCRIVVQDMCPEGLVSQGESPHRRHAWPATSSRLWSMDPCHPPLDLVISGLDPAVGGRRGARSLSSYRLPVLVTTDCF
jgi:hypothetical protein